jgi:DNA invertase Pin-like site-specific DNA recombinase
LELDGYVRVSRVGGRSGESFISPDHQRQQIENWAALRGVTIANWETDLDKTGRKLERPGMDRIMARIESGATEGIAVAYIERFSRAGVADALKLVEKIVDQGGSIAAVDLGLDPTTPFGEFGLTIMLALARMQSRRIEEMWLAARTRAVDRGVHISGQPPTGYQRRGDGRLAPDPAISPYVTEAFFRRAAGDSWKAIADWLTEQGVPTLRGAPNWTIATVSTIVRNRVYLGEARSGDLVKLGAHEPLVDVETWEAANQRRGPLRPSTGNAAGMLSGIIRCAGCSFALKPSMGRTRHGKLRREYRCRPDKAAGRCLSPASASAEPLERAVVERFFFAYGDLFASFHRRTNERDEIELRIAEGRAELSAALDARLVEALGGEESETYLATVRRRREAIEADEEVLAGLDDTGIDLPRPAELQGDWGKRTMQQKRVLIASAYDSIFLRRARSPREPVGDRLRLFPAGAGPPLPVRGKRGVIRSVDVD